ncbi:MAG: hypothetical protein HY727_14310 [Candidatus Rokubacteria bacterium]|nr:hypothetical protein [Candidatus Rokubacteria bacterium]
MRARRLLGTTALALLVSATWSVLASAQPRRELRVGVSGLPATLEPGTALEGAVPLVARQVFDTLVAYREASTDVEGALAVQWTVSRDGLVWSFTLREGVRFHDGAPLSGAEVAASFERHLRPDPQGPPLPVWGALLRGTPGVVKEVRAADARTVQIVLVQPYAPLLTVLAHPGLAVARATLAADGSRRLVGTGPYRLAEVSAGRLVLDAFPQHWGGPPRAERIVFLEIGSDEHAEAEFDARALDVWFPPGPPRRGDGALSIPGLRVGYLAFQTEKEPFSRKKVRQAVATALDPAALAAVLERGAIPLQSFLPPGVWARREGSPVLGGTRAMAKKLLREGGWPPGFTPTLLVPSESGPPSLERLAEALQSLLAEVGMPVKIREESATAMRGTLQAGEHDLVLTEATVAGGDPHLLLFPLSTSEGASKGPRALNFSFYRNPRLDDVLIRASQLSFRPERLRLYQRAQGMLAEELPWIPLYVRLQWTVARPEVRGLRLHPTGFHRLATVGLDAGAQQ